MAEMANTTDAQLVASFLAGDQAALGEIYDRYADRIYSYCLTMLRNREDAADAAHDAFVKAATRMEQLDNPDKLRPWLFSIARNEAHGQGRQRARVTPNEDLSEALVEEPDMAMAVKQAELRQLVWAAAGGLGERDRDLMAFHLVEGLEGDDLAEAMGVETGHVHVLVSRMKDRVERAMGALLIARLGSDECDELADVLQGWDGTFDMAVRSKVTRHIESCEVCQERRAFLLAPANVLPGILLVPAPAALRDRVLGAIEPKPLVPAGALDQSWVKGLAFAAVALLMGVIGFAVSAQFEPLDTPPTIPIAADTSTTAPLGVTTTTVLPSETSTTESSTATSTTLPPDDALLVVDDTALDFGDSDSVRSFVLTNNGGIASSWDISPGASWVSVSSGSGELAPEASVTIEVTIDRLEADEGDIEETMEVVWDGGTIDVTMTADTNANPILSVPQVSPESVVENAGTFCRPTQATVTVRVRDASPLDSVVVRWGGQETPMIDTGNDMWEGVVGPFLTVGQETVRIVAFDDLGNAGGAATTIDVTPCT